MCTTTRFESRNLRPSRPRGAKALALFSLAAILWMAIGASVAQAQFWSSSRLLLPYFEVDLEHPGGATTFAAVVNTADGPVTVQAEVYSNWGVRIFETTFEMEARAAYTINLADWLQHGALPDRQLMPSELDHVVAAFSGQRSPFNDLFYSSEVTDAHGLPLAVGYVTFHIPGTKAPDVLIGDFFQIDGSGDSAQGQAMINVDPGVGCDKICERHGLRFMEGAFDAGTELFIWNLENGEASFDGFLKPRHTIETTFIAYDMQGRLLDVITYDLMPLERLAISDLALPESFGWLDVTTVEPSFMSVRYGALGRFSVGLKTFCLPALEGKIEIEKRTNGQSADVPPGPSIESGAAVRWTYEVRNTGTVRLTGIEVTDNRVPDVDCPDDTLDPDETMTCGAEGFAECGQYSNLGQASGWTPSGQRVIDYDRSHYLGKCEAGIRLEKSTNGFDADGLNDPMDDTLTSGDPVTWEYVVTNLGEVALTDLTVEDDREGPITGCATTLAPSASTTCSKTGTATSPQPLPYGNIGTACAKPAGATEAVCDDDPSHYRWKDIEPSSIVLIKHVENSHGGTAQVEDFALFVNGVQVQSGAPSALSAGTYTASEINLPGYTAGPWGGDCDPNGVVTLLAGESKACEITNYDQAAMIKVVKHVINDDGGTATVADFALFVGAQQVTSGVLTPMAPGVYTVSEQSLPGYTASSWSGDCDPNGVVTLVAGEMKVCEITNNDDPRDAWITLIKYVINDHGGTATVGDFDLFVDGLPVTSSVAIELPAGTYTASEHNLPGYTAGLWGGDCAADGTVTLQPGDHKTCMITNNDDPAMIKVIKRVINDDGGTAGVSDFALFVGAQQVTSGVLTPMAAGTYTVSEHQLDGYTASFWSGDCAANGIVTLVNGQTKTCMITNDDDPRDAWITLIKRVINDHGGTATVGDFDLFVGTQQVTSGVAIELPAGTYTASEHNLPGYTPSAWGGDCAANGTVTLRAGDHKTCMITNDDQPAMIKVIKRVINDDGGTATVGDFDLFVGAQQVQSGVFTSMAAGTYTVSEHNLPGYTPSPWSGDCDGNGKVTLVAGQTKTCMITNDDIPIMTCGECDGKVTQLTLRYNGNTPNAHIKVVQKKDGKTAFDGIVQPGGAFSFVGQDDKGTLSTEIKIYVNGVLNAAIHTSCSQPIGPGLVSGDFEVLAGASRNGGPLCPVGGGCDGSDSDSECDGGSDSDSGSDDGESDGGSDDGESDGGSDDGESDGGSDDGESDGGSDKSATLLGFFGFGEDREPGHEADTPPRAASLHETALGFDATLVADRRYGPLPGRPPAPTRVRAAALRVVSVS